MDSYVTDIDAMLDQLEEEDNLSPMPGSHIRSQEDSVTVKPGLISLDTEANGNSSAFNLNSSVLDAVILKSYVSTTNDLDLELKEPASFLLSVDPCSSNVPAVVAPVQPVLNESEMDESPQPATFVGSFHSDYSTCGSTESTAESGISNVAGVSEEESAVEAPESPPFQSETAPTFSSTSPVDFIRSFEDFQGPELADSGPAATSGEGPGSIDVTGTDDSTAPSEGFPDISALEPTVRPDSLYVAALPVRSAEAAVGYQSSLWTSIEDVSDSELDEFLENVQSKQQENLLDEGHYCDEKALAADLVAVEEALPRHPSYYVVGAGDIDQIRLSPPLELSAPVPMQLIDVNELMDVVPSSPAETSLQSEPQFQDLYHESSLPFDHGVSEGVLIDLLPGRFSGDELLDSGASEYSLPVEGTIPLLLDDDRSVDEMFNKENDVLPHPTAGPVIFSVDNLGKVKPEWVPDECAPICMLCGTRFTLVKRRHHCRACGSVICASCGNYRAHLEYLDMKEDRICALCNETYRYKRGDISDRDRIQDSMNRSLSPSITVVASPSAPGTIPPGVLRRRDQPRNSIESKSVVFFDGIRPGGDLMEPEFHGNGRKLAIMNAKRQRRSPGAPPEAPPPPKPRTLPKRSSASHVVRLYATRDFLPVMELTQDGQYILHEHPDVPQLLLKFSTIPSECVDFFVNACLRISVQLLDLKCCVEETAWCYSTNGMRLYLVTWIERERNGSLAKWSLFRHLLLSVKRVEGPTPSLANLQKVRPFKPPFVFVYVDSQQKYRQFDQTSSDEPEVGQDEIVILLEKQDTDVLPPRDIFIHLNEIFLHAKQGNVIGNLGHSIVALNGYTGGGFLGNSNNAGFMFVRHTSQCLNSIRLPEAPFLFGLLMSKWEVPWAKLFPLRLMLRFGAEYRYYPCRLVSYRDRKAVYEEVGHTVMNLLCDFRNFQYHLPCVEDTECCLEKSVIRVTFPRHRYDQIVKVCQASNDHVLPIGLGFSRRADAHLVCVQNLDSGQYETQAINIKAKGREVTGASFIIFNGSLKSTDSTECRASVVEDGIMVQVTLRGLEDMKTALKAMKNVVLTALSTSGTESGRGRDTVVIEWTNDPKTCNLGVRSPVDGKNMSGIESRRVSLKHSTDFLNGTLCVRCTEVFLTDEKENNKNYREEIDLSRLAENLAMASCSVLRAHLYDYRDAGSTKIGLRVTLGPDLVEYDVGAKGERFAPEFLMEFDDKIMPLVNECARAWNDRPRLEMELIFRIFQH